MVRLNNTPNPNWKLGDPLKTPDGDIVSLNTDNLKVSEVYHLMISTIVPRPIAFVSTVNSNGVGNLSPFSFFNGISSNPPYLMISISVNSDGSKKDTLRNIESNREMVINTVNEWIVEPMHQCSASYPHGVDEMSKVGLTSLNSLRVKPKRVKEAPIQMECKLHEIYQLGDGGLGSASLVIAQIVQFHIYSSIYKNNRIDPEQLKPVARMGGSDYTLLGNLFKIKRPIL